MGNGASALMTITRMKQRDGSGISPVTVKLSFPSPTKRRRAASERKLIIQSCGTTDHLILLQKRKASGFCCIFKRYNEWKYAFADGYTYKGQPIIMSEF